MNKPLAYSLLFIFVLLGLSSCKESLTEEKKNHSVKNINVDIRSSFISKLDLLSEKLGRTLNMQDTVEAVLNGEFTDDEAYFFLEDLTANPESARYTDLQYIYYFLGSRDHNRVLNYYFTEVVNVKVIQLEDSGFIFPDHDNDYTIHQEMRLLFCAVAGWYHSTPMGERADILEYINLLSRKFNKVISAKEIMFFRLKKYSEAL